MYVIRSLRRLDYNNMISVKSSPLLTLDHANNTARRVRRSRWLRSQQKWMKEVKPKVVNPFHNGGETNSSLPNFVPKMVGARMTELEYVSADALKQLNFMEAEGHDRAHLLDCMRTAVKYQQESINVLRGMLEQGGRSPNRDMHCSDNSGHHLNLFQIQEIDEVSINLDPNEKGSTSDDFLFKDPTTPTRYYNTDPHIHHQFHNSDMAEYFF